MSEHTLAYSLRVVAEEGQAVKTERCLRIFDESKAEVQLISCNASTRANEDLV